ncbi:MAG TPA: non-homologous end-joining DNA ligase [Dehalococcoidia bacterium]|nr:non-homologous end-joining DNA ligase [Dehalococcoidia bacterium]
MPDLPPPDLDALLKYRQKRDFSRTPEPDAGAAPDSGDLTFVVQQHAARRMHWDFRLEVDGVLWSWAVPKGPSLNPRDKRMAAQTEDHPFDYGGFEGVIPKGNYGAGQVIVWDRGTYTPDEDGEFSWGDKEAGSRRMREGLAAGKLSFTLRGEKLRGSWTLVKTRQSENSWLLIKHRDEYASDRDVLEEDRSVISGLTIQDLKEGRMPPLSADGAAPHPDAVEAPFPDPRSLRPMLATLTDRAFSRPGWLFEPKLDGVRALAFVRGDGEKRRVELRTRRGNDTTVQYPEVCEDLRDLDVESAVLDGEVVALNEQGVPDFQSIQPRINLSRPVDVERAAAETPVCYYVFDILYLNGFDLRAVPLADRKRILRRLGATEHIKHVDYTEADGETMYRVATDLGFEGVVAKRATSPYEAGLRTQAWLKVKNVNEQEFVVGGFTQGEGSRAKTFGGLLVGYYDGDDLRFAASVGSGITDRMLSEIRAKLDEIRVDEPPFVNAPEAIKSRWGGTRNATCFWVKPELVAQVQFNSWTREGYLRAPVFKGLRTDIDPRAVRREEPPAPAVSVIASEEAAAPPPRSEIERLAAAVVAQLDGDERANFTLEIGDARIKLTNLDKEFWPATESHGPRTKRELVRYYARVAPYLLPHLKDRPLTLTRYPNGIQGKSFYQKHWPHGFPSEFHVDRVRLYSSQNEEDQEYILCNNLPTLIWLAQLADIEMHAQMARVDPEPDGHDLPRTFTGSEENLEASLLNYPDFMIFDLDPYIYAGHEKMGDEPELNRRAFNKTREVALALKELLQQLRLSSFIKTTGKTGLHIYVPVLRHYNYDQIRAAAEVVGRYLIQQLPDDITMEWATTKRTGKVFFDHNQNTRGKTLAAEYSLRPSPGATVSAPVSWQELERVYPTDFDIDTMPERLAKVGDLWADILGAKQDLRALIEA